MWLRYSFRIYIIFRPPGLLTVFYHNFHLRIYHVIETNCRHCINTCMIACQYDHYLQQPHAPLCEIHKACGCCQWWLCSNFETISSTLLFIMIAALHPTCLLYLTAVLFMIAIDVHHMAWDEEFLSLLDHQ